MTRRVSAARSRRRRALGDRGVSAVEYGLMLAALVAVVVVAVFAYGAAVNQSFEDSTACLAYNGVGEPDC